MGQPENENKEQVQFQIDNSVEITPGVTLNAGVYEGECRQLGVHINGQVQWQSPQYFATLSRNQLTLATQAEPYVLAEEFELTRHVGEGKIKVKEAHPRQKR